MTPTELRAALTRLGISQAETARVLGVDDRTVRRWAAGDRDIPQPAIRLLWACERDAGLLVALSVAGDGLQNSAVVLQTTNRPPVTH
jgi:DNA-binding transcriptional regulator YiaG